METLDFIELAQEIIDGKIPPDDTFAALARLPEQSVFKLMAGADVIREHTFGRSVHLCSICNAKSGRCSEDCRFCAQSSHARTDAPVYDLLPADEIGQGAEFASQNSIHRYSVVTSGRGLSKQNIQKITDTFKKITTPNVDFCASLGIIKESGLEKLGQAGITRYHHNLETAESFFPEICTTHTYQERIDTIKAARAAGLSVCCGGVLGLGESEEQVLELALTLRELGVDAVPLNFLTPIKGTALAQNHNLTPLKCLKYIALYRYVLPQKDILICGGRDHNLGMLQSFIFHAGASGIMTGNYLTTEGKTVDHDRTMIEMLGFTLR